LKVALRATFKNFSVALKVSIVYTALRAFLKTKKNFKSWRSQLLKFFLAIKKARSAVKTIETLRATEKFLKVARSVTFKNFSGFYDSVKRCIQP